MPLEPGLVFLYLERISSSSSLVRSRLISSRSLLLNFVLGVLVIWGVS